VDRSSALDWDDVIDLVGGDDAAFGSAHRAERMFGKERSPCLCPGSVVDVCVDLVTKGLIDFA
jgi:hypothetical protein